MEGSFFPNKSNLSQKLGINNSKISCKIILLIHYSHANFKKYIISNKLKKKLDCLFNIDWPDEKLLSSNQRACYICHLFISQIWAFLTHKTVQLESLLYLPFIHKVCAAFIHGIFKCLLFVCTLIQSIVAF